MSDIYTTDADVEAAPEADDSQLRRIADLAAEQVRLNAEVVASAAAHAELVERLRLNREVELPEAMRSAGQLACMTEAGWAEVKTSVSASISATNAAEAFAWLDENGHGALIKRACSWSFGREQANAAGEFVERARLILEELGCEAPLTDKKSVHAQTLGAFVREQLELGVDIPRKALGVYEMTYAEVGGQPKAPKVKKPKTKKTKAAGI